MNTTKHTQVNRRRTLVATAVAFILVVGCAVPISSVGANHDSTHARMREAGTAKIQVPSAQAQGAEQKMVSDQDADHGLAFMLGDVHFASGRVDLQLVATNNLNRLVTFLDKYPDRRVAIHGYTDSIGSEEFNQGLSKRRANSVKTYLTTQGIDSTRLFASGMGQGNPVASDDSGAGRQQNRRVEVIISDSPATLTQQARAAKTLALLALLESLSGNTGRPLL